MKYVANTKALMLAGVLGITTLSGAALANTSTDSKSDADIVDTSPGNTIVLDNIKLSGNAQSVLSNVHNARLALFEGNTDAAIQLVENAHGAFREDVASHSIKLNDDQGYAVPLDYSIEMDEDFKPSEDNAEAMAKAGYEAQQGNTSEAVKIMAEAGVDMSVKFAMLPAAKTIKKLDKIKTDLIENKFYEANLELKTIATSVMLEGFELSASPVQGHDLKDILGS